MKVLIYGMTDNLGGLETFILNYMKHLQSKKIKFDFITTYKHLSIEDDVKLLGGKIYHIANKRVNYFAYRKQFKSFMKEHANEYGAVWLNDCMFCNLDILIFGKAYGIKRRIVHAHNSKAMGNKLQLIRHTIHKYFLYYVATDYWACSSLAAKWSYPKKIYNNVKYLIIPNAIDSKNYKFNIVLRENVREKLSLDNKYVIGNVGRLHFQKNQMLLLDIFKGVLNLNKQSVLMLIGEGDDKEKLQKRAIELGILDNVMFMGARNDVSELLQAMDVYVMPSRFEGFGIAAIEAQASGLPCIMSNVLPPETKVTDNTMYIDIRAPIRQWVDTILSFQEHVRVDETNNIAQHGYDIGTAALDLYAKLELTKQT